MMLSRSIIVAGLVLFGALSSQAHDPGLSSAKLSLQGSTLHALLTFAPGDIDAIANGEKLDKAHLKSLAASSLEIWFDGRPASPIETKATLLANKDVEFELVYSVATAARLKVRSTMLERLPFGHRQYFSLTGVNGATVAEKLLSSANQDIEVVLAATAIATASPSHPFYEFLGMGIRHILTGYDHL